jgi:hypothetical protein
MKLHLNTLRQKIGELLYETTGAHPCCGEELAKITTFPDGKHEMFITLRIAKDCNFNKNGLVEVHDWAFSDTPV